MNRSLSMTPAHSDVECIAAGDPSKWSVSAMIHLPEVFPAELRTIAREALHHETRWDRRDEIVEQVSRSHPTEARALLNLSEYCRWLVPEGC